MDCLQSRTVFTGRNEVVAKVIFLHLSVILFMGGKGVVVSHKALRQTPPDLAHHPPAPDLTHHPPPQTWHTTPPQTRHTTPPWTWHTTPPDQAHHPQTRTWHTKTTPPDLTNHHHPPPDQAHHPPPWTWHTIPPGPDTPPDQAHPPGPDTPPPPLDLTPPGIRSTSGRYASYWNAFLFDGFVGHCGLIQRQLTSYTWLY